MIRLTSLIILLFASASLVAQDSGPATTVGSIDFFGLRRVSEAEVRAVLKFKEGDPISREAARAVFEDVRKVAGVSQASVAPVTVDGTGKLRIFVGVVEQGAPALEWRAKPEGEQRLTVELRKLYEDSMAVLGAVVRRGSGREDYTEGHSLSADPEMRKPQEAAVVALKTQTALVREVLLNSGSEEDRRAAAWLLGYAPDKKAIIPALLEAASDPDSVVRNNATRALGPIASYADANPALGISIPADIYIDMLQSVTWTDLNKASFVLSGLTAKRDPALLRALRERALPVLSDMARWRSEGHAYPAIRILGRIAGWTDEEVAHAVNDDRIEKLIAAASAAK
ncbi:MAG TPA: HEAT repeat domain-containing protein [Opitutaceae bacterium]